MQWRAEYEETRMSESSLFSYEKDYFHSGVSFYFWHVIVHYGFSTTTYVEPGQICVIIMNWIFHAHIETNRKSV